MDEKEAEARPIMGTIFLVSISYSICNFFFSCRVTYKSDVNASIATRSSRK